jgi:hypothetical protein
MRVKAMRATISKTKMVAWTFLSMASCGVDDAAADAPAISQLRYSADVGANFIDASTYAARKDFIVDDLAGTRTRQQIPDLPDTVNLADFHVESNNDILFAVDIGLTLGGTYFSPADVVRWNGTTYSKEFDSAAAGVPAGVHCDGVARWGDTGSLLLSFDRTFAANGITIRPADVIAFRGGAFDVKVLDAQALGLLAAFNVDAIDTYRTKDYLLVSFDTGGAVGGVTFTSADVLQWHRTDATWSKRFAVRFFSDRWEHANLDGVAAVNLDTIFQDDFE